MTTETNTDQDKAFQEQVEAVARALTLVRHDRDGSILSLPVLYPGGTMAGVRVTPQQRGRFLVTDMGLGYREAELMGGARLFDHAAPAVAHHAGIKLDRHAFLLTDVSPDQLIGAVTVIAACSQEAVLTAALKLEEKKQSDAAERLYQRLVGVFTVANVARDVEVLGASNTSWHVSTLVRLDGHRAIYEPVTSHANSVASAMTKFIDLGQLEQPPARIAVVRSKKDMGTKLSLIATAASVVEDGVSDQTLERLALEAA